jgi:ArsR family transcriptional regulator
MTRDDGRELLKPGSQDLCEVYNDDERTVALVRPQMPSDVTFAEACKHFNALAEPIRAKILYAISRHEMCVCEIAKVVGASISSVSHQLRFLRGLDLVTSRKEAQLVYYRLKSDVLRSLLTSLVGELEEWPQERREDPAAIP